MWHAICERLSEHSGQSVKYMGNRPLSGGCIHHSQVLETNRGRFFVKLNQPDKLPIFEAEAEGLRAIAASATIRCPKVEFCDRFSGQALLLLEFIPMQSARVGGMDKLGRQLAALHRQTQDHFGWHIDNHIGLTPQPNHPEDSWVTFLREYRLGHQIRICARKGLHLQGAEKLLENLDRFFEGYSPMPSLLHGDLWGGNASFDEQGEPVLFDPACYYGDREADLAFTEMFGGFSPEFYTAYGEAFPLHSGYPIRKRLYNLYHELNHFYLFGGGYGNQARETVRYLLRSL